MFAFKLALALGCTLKELGERMSYGEFLEWMAYYKERPWGFEIEDMRHATIVAMTLNSGLMASHSKKRLKPFSPKDYMYKPVEKEKNKKPLSERIANKLFGFINRKSMEKKHDRGRKS